MEETGKELQQQQPTAVPVKTKLRYPLRSATKTKVEKAGLVELPNSSASRRARPASTVSKSVSVLDLSGKEKSAKPPRRLSTPAKSASPATKPLGSVTPIPERAKRSTNGQERSGSPASTVSRTSTRKKFDVLASASYWLKQIKLSESVAKHSVSLGLFKLALEAKCEPLQQMRVELKSYVRHNDLSEIGDFVKELFESYNISDNQEQVQVSETCSQVPEEGTRSSDEEVHSSSSTMEPAKLRPRSLNADTGEVSPVTSSAKKETTQKVITYTRTRGALNKSNSRPVPETGSQKAQKKLTKPSKQDMNKEKGKIKQQDKKSIADKVSPTADVDTPEENKENMDAQLTEEADRTEVV